MKTTSLRKCRCATLCYVAALLAMVVPSGKVLGDGSETLGPPVGISLAPGSEFTLAGVGLAETNKGVLSLVIPRGASVQQVLLYWQGMSDGEAGDDTVAVNGVRGVTGQRIGGPTQIFPGVFESAYRADITTLGRLHAGTNELEISGVDFSRFNNGAGAIVIYSNAPPGLLRLVDGDDFALESYLSPLDTTVPQRFSFRASTQPRTAQLGLLVGGADGRSIIHLGVSRHRYSLTNVLASANGEAWDSLQIPVQIPAGATNLAVQIVSGDGSQSPGESAVLTWVAAILSVPPPQAGAANRPPQVTLLPVRPRYCTAGDGRRVTVYGRVVDRDSDSLRVNWFVNGANVKNETLDLSATNAAPFSLTYYFPVGTNTVRVEVLDGTNAPVSARTIVRVFQDTEPPEVICDRPKTRRANPHGIAHVPGFGIRAWDNCTSSDQLVKVQTPPPGTAVEPGTHLITIQVTDAAGNTATCTTSLIVTPHPTKVKPPKPDKSKAKDNQGKGKGNGNSDRD